MKYKIVVTNRFKKDIKLAKKRNLDLSYLKEVIDVLSRGDKLPSKYKDHALTGDYDNFRECHIKPNWLLLYLIDDNEIELLLFRTGSHSDIYN